MANEGTTTLNIRCLCGAAKFTSTVPNSKLPLDAGFCHCDSCRHVHGTLALEDATWPDGPPSDLSHMGKYAFTPRTDVYFCTTCGTTMFIIGNGVDQFCAFTLGTLDIPQGSKELIKFGSHHIFVADTKDGGASGWLPKIKGNELKRFVGHVEGGEELSESWPGEVKRPPTLADKLHASCLCKGVQFSITRPDKNQENPELIDPRAKERGAWWLDPITGDRYMAGLCVCESCRLGSGSDFVPWAFIPDHNIVLPDGSTLSMPSTFGTLKSYRSSPGVLRYFCGTCGAQAFFHNEERFHLVDIAVGLFLAEEGARAESWLWWRTEGVSHKNEGLDRGVLVQDLLNGMKSWRELRAG